MSATKKPAKGAKKKPTEAPAFRPFEALVKETKRAAREAAAKKPEPAAPGATKQPAAAKAAKSVTPKAPIAADVESFAMFMSGVAPIGHAKTRIPVGETAIERAERMSPEAIARAVEAADEPAREALQSLVTDPIRFDVMDDGGHLEGRRVDVDPRELRRLRHGRYVIDAKLDLHGLSLVEARVATRDFVRRRHAEGDRAVVIVHGKGRHSPSHLPVLRGEIGAWLTDASAARHVLAFTTAPDDDGGSGATYVLLAR